MKATKHLFFLAFAIALSFSACKEDKKDVLTPDNNVTLKFVLMDESKSVALYDTVILNTGYEFRLDLFRLYVSNITFIKDDNSEHLVKDVDILTPINGEDNSTMLSVPFADYTALKIGFGLDAEQNMSDPTSFSQDHPLSNYQNMFWPMINYRFAKFEGRAEQISSDTAYQVAIHPGKDPLYKVHSYDFASVLNIDAGTSTQLVIKLDINDIFDGPAGIIDFSKEGANQVHMEDPMDDIIGDRFMENMAQATYLEVN